MNVSLIEIIKRLVAQGHKVEYTHRKDGGYVIRRIDGTHYSGKTGNAMARIIAGAKLSEARQVQLARIKTPKGKWGHQKKMPIPDDVKKALRKVQQEWRKKHPDIRGTATTSNVRYYLEKYGKEATMIALDKAHRYAMGYAYIDNVNFLIERINNDLSIDNDPDMIDIVELIERKKIEFKEEWIAPCYQAIYEWEKGAITGQECARRIRAILI